MDDEKKKLFTKIANTVRDLAMDATQAANSGHPGLPMGCAELGAYLWGEEMRYNPKESKWIARDRFVLSAGHGCLLLYSYLHLSGYDLSLEEIKNFRQLHSKTPGHPEYGITDGVEVTTGPLGQGIGNSVGLALGYKILEKKFNTSEHKIFDNKIFCLAGDGCLMEGVSHEVCSLAGHWDLDNLILIYDDNKICLDGPTSECFTDNTEERFKAYSWDVVKVDGYDFDAMEETFSSLRKNQKKPTLVMVSTIIGKGSPHKQGTHKAHGSPLGEEEVKETKELLGLPEEPFYIPQPVKTFFEEKLKHSQARYNEWAELFEKWSHANPELRKEYEAMHMRPLPDDLEAQLKGVKIEQPIAGRSASQTVLAKLGEILPHLYGGSADLSGSDSTMMKEYPIISHEDDFAGRNIKYGVREFGMACIATGLSRTEMMTPFVGTFLTFSDYMRNAIRVASIGHHYVVYQFTHDSIFLGEDGPTHQPVEHYMALRAIPNLQVIRPADANEVKMGWLAALRYHGPTAQFFTRQKLPEVPGTDVPFSEGVGRGAYIVKKEAGKADYMLVATGSELHLAYNVAIELEKHDKAVRVVSMPCWELFEQQPPDYKHEVFGGDLGQRVAIEAGVDQGWYKYIGSDGLAICMESFGASAPASALAKEFGFTVDDILERILSHKPVVV